MIQTKGDNYPEKRRYWQEHVEACERGGNHPKRYCIEQEISKPLYYYWRRRLRTMQGGSELPLPSRQRDTGATGFAKVIEIGGAESLDGARIKVRLLDFELGNLCELKQLLSSRCDGVGR